MTKLIRKVIFLSLLIFIFPVVLTAMAMSQDSNKPDTEARLEKAKTRIEAFQESTEEKKAKMEERMEQHCSDLTNRMSNRLEVFESNKDLHGTNYENLISKIDDIISAMKDKGYDTSSLEANLAKLDTMVDEYVAAYELLIELLEEANSYVCGESAGEFKTVVKAARDQLKALHDLRKDIRKFYITEIREDIRDLRKQTPTSTEVVEETEE